jgi:hypothetical protein
MDVLHGPARLFRKRAVFAATTAAAIFILPGARVAAQQCPDSAWFSASVTVQTESVIQQLKQGSFNVKRVGIASWQADINSVPTVDWTDPCRAVIVTSIARCLERAGLLADEDRPFSFRLSSNNTALATATDTFIIAQRYDLGHGVFYDPSQHQGIFGGRRVDAIIFGNYRSGQGAVLSMVCVLGPGISTGNRFLQPKQEEIILPKQAMSPGAGKGTIPYDSALYLLTLLVDCSGSMIDNDPRAARSTGSYRLALAAAKIRGPRILLGFIGFDDRLRWVDPPALVWLPGVNEKKPPELSAAKKHAEKVLKDIAKIDNGGLTDLVTALNTAYHQATALSRLNHAPVARKDLLLFTDGRHNVRHGIHDSMDVAALAPKFRAEGIHVWVAALGTAADVDKLSKLADGTQARLWSILDTSQITPFLGEFLGTYPPSWRMNVGGAGAP